MGATTNGGAGTRRDRREDLLVAAARRFVASGIRATTMEDIAREAGAGKATLYRHFRNKDAVVEALLAREADRFVQLLSAAADARPDAASKLEAAFTTGVRFFVEHPVLTTGRDEGPAVLLPRVTADGGPLVTRGLALFADLIEVGVQDGELRNVEPMAAAEVVMRLILSYYAFPPMHVRVEDEAEAAAFAHALVAGGLRRRA
ncbi:MAG: TetR/AcrR family transcriptional regulator [Nitriliruptoraceae bacterium]|nr:TetR/AcrR family transcriptional regulator [Nitriliruptoraceae bacterium]